MSLDDDTDYQNSPEPGANWSSAQRIEDLSDLQLAQAHSQPFFWPWELDSTHRTTMRDLNTTVVAAENLMSGMDDTRPGSYRPSESAMDGTAAQAGTLQSSVQSADVNTDGFDETPIGGTGPSQGQSSADSLSKQSRSSSMSLDSSHRPFQALSVASDQSSWGFTRVTGFPSRPPRSDSTFRTSITRALETNTPLRLSILR